MSAPIRSLDLRQHIPAGFWPANGHIVEDRPIIIDASAIGLPSEVTDSLAIYPDHAIHWKAGKRDGWHGRGEIARLWGITADSPPVLPVVRERVEKRTDPHSLTDSQWLAHHAQHVKQAQTRLATDSRALAYLHDDRHLTDETIRQFGLGSGRIGIVISWPGARVIQTRHWDGEKRFWKASAPSRFHFGEIRPDSSPVIIQESAFDAILAWQEVGSLASCIATWGASFGLTDDVLARLKDRRVIIIRDNDKAGKGAAVIAQLPGATVVTTPQGKDLTEYATAAGVEAARAFIADILRPRDGDDWCTPADKIELARSVMGSIDIDPASNAYGQQFVKATTYFTRADDGLTKDWPGNVWLNPPYSSKLVTQFTTRLVEQYKAGITSQAIVLVNNQTDAKWFHALVEHASAICFHKGRIKFHRPDKTSSSPRQGQVFLYLGPDVARFKEIFSPYGGVVRQVKQQVPNRVVETLPEFAPVEPTPDEWSCNGMAALYEVLKHEAVIGRSAYDMIAAARTFNYPPTTAELIEKLGWIPAKFSQVKSHIGSLFFSSGSILFRNRLEEEKETYRAIPEEKPQGRGKRPTRYQLKSFDQCVEGWIEYFERPRVEMDCELEFNAPMIDATIPQVRELGSVSPETDADTTNDHLNEVLTLDEKQVEARKAQWIEARLQTARDEIMRFAARTPDEGDTGRPTAYTGERLTAALASYEHREFSQETTRDLTGMTPRAADKRLFEAGYYRQEHIKPRDMMSEPARDGFGNYRYDPDHGKPIAAIWKIHGPDGEKSIRVNLRSKRGRKVYKQHLAQTSEPTKILYQKTSTLERLDTLTEGAQAEVYSRVFSKREKGDPMNNGKQTTKPRPKNYHELAIERGKRQARLLGLDLPDDIEPRELLAALLAWKPKPVQNDPALSFSSIPDHIRETTEGLGGVLTKVEAKPA